MKRIQFFAAVLFVVAGLSACSAAKEAATPAVVAPPTASLRPLPTPSQPAPSLTPSPGPTDTATPSPTATPVLPVMTSHDVWTGTITPIATPPSGRQAYRLKSWTEADALEMIHVLEVAAHDNDVIMPVDSRWLFQTAYRPVELAVQEMLDRFPATPYRETLEWRLAMARVIQGKSDSDAWILSTIERDLNAKRFTLAELDAGLRQYGFKVAQQVPAPNLFGDGAEATVYRVEAQDSYGEQGLFFAVRESDSGSYTLTPIYSDWPIPAADDRIVEVQDHNRNGIPEVILETSVASGTMCFSQVLSFEWQGQRFVDLTRGQINSDDCLDWSIGAPDSAGIDTLTMRTSMEYQDRYAWNGTYYELAERDVFNPFMGCSDYNELLNGWEDYRHGIGALQAVLQNWPAENTPLGLSCPDYLRFRIGWTYALHGQRAEAQTVFHSLVLSPTNPLTPTIPLAAKAFLETYTAGPDIYRSCSAAQASLAKALAPYQNDASQLTQAIGFFFNGDVGAGLCDSQVPFPLLVNALGRSATTNPIPVLQQAGSGVQASARLDLNGDGVQDWPVALNNAGQPTLWALLNTRQGFQAVLLDDYFGADLTGLNTITVTTYTLPTTGTALLILPIGSNLDLYQFQRPQTGGAAHIVLSARDVQNYAFRQSGPTLELEIAHKPDPTYFQMMSIYTWDEQSEDFVLLPLYDNDIFTGKGPAGALPELERIVANVKETAGVKAVDQPGLFYLLGLAYELTGDNTQAAATYWRLWHDFPDSTYALMAQHKLEASAP